MRKSSTSRPRAGAVPNLANTIADGDLDELGWRALANSLPAMVGIWSPRGQPLFFNDRWFEYTGLPRGALTAADVRNVFHPEESPALEAMWQESLRTGEGFAVEARARRHDGAYRWQIGNAAPIRSAAGAVRAWISSIIDIDPRKQAEGALLKSERRFRQLADAMPQIVWTALPDGLVDHFNRRWYEFTGGREGEEELGDWLSAVHPDDRESSIAAWAESLKTGEPFQMNERLREGATGTYRWHLSRALPVRDEAGEIVRWFGTSTDIEELVRAEQALTEESRVVESLQEIGVTLTAELDLHRVVQRVIESATRLTGAAFGVFFYNLVGEDGETVTRYALAGADDATFREIPLPRETRLFATSLSGKQTRISDDVTRDPDFGKNPPFFGWPEGHPAIRSYLSAPVTSRSGEGLGALFFGHPEAGKFGGREERIAAGIAGWAAVAVDNARLFAASERKTEELKKANAAKDEFLGLVSHELKTPITTIFGNAEVLRRRFDRLDDESRVAALADISNEAERLHRIIDNLLVLARLERGQAINAEPLLLRRLVDSIAAEHRRRFPQRVIHIEVPREALPISGEPVYVEQVIRNLLSNAEKYSPPDQPIEVLMRRVGNSMEISVLDRGRGFAPEEAEVIFTPFYRSPRTADVAGGVGVGLAVCKRLIEAQGGRVWARPREQGGAEIGFSLPVAE